MAIAFNKRLHLARFLCSAPNFESLPPDIGTEVAFSGRSNVGKSSVLNTLFNQNNLASISAKPGKTKHINLFALGGNAEATSRLVDLPGYGYAQISVVEQARWKKELTRYILERKSLKGVVLVTDARRELDERDMAMIELCRAGDKPVFVIRNKSDKLKKRYQNTKGKSESILFSTLKKTGLKELQVVLGRWFSD